MGVATKLDRQAIVAVMGNMAIVSGIIVFHPYSTVEVVVSRPEFRGRYCLDCVLLRYIPSF